MASQYGADQTLHEEVFKANQLKTRAWKPYSCWYSGFEGLTVNDAFAQTQVDNLVKELEEWSLLAKREAIIYVRLADFVFCCQFPKKCFFSIFCWKTKRLLPFRTLFRSLHKKWSLMGCRESSSGNFKFFEWYPKNLLDQFECFGNHFHTLK